MRTRRFSWLLLLIALLAAVGYGGWWAWSTYPAVFGQFLQRWGLNGPPAEPSGQRVSGLIEADAVKVSAETSGRMVALLVAEGDWVEAGQLVIGLDTALLDAQAAQADAAVAVAEAQLALVSAKARPEEWRVARAGVALAEANLAAARQAWQDACTLRDNPQDLDVRIVAAHTEVRVCERSLVAARAEAQAADLQLEYWGRTVQLLGQGLDIEIPAPGGGLSVHVPAGSDKVQAASLQWNLASQSAWQAHEAESEAEASLACARTALSHLLAQREDPLALQAQVDAAAAQIEIAEKAVTAARAGLAALREGAGQEQIAVAQASLAQAWAGREALLVRRNKLELRAPRAGLVVACPAHQGELALAGSPLLEIADLGNVMLTVYVPADRLGAVRLGQSVPVTVDSFPDRVFRGEASRIADEAEFTPGEASMGTDEVILVFAVEVRLDNADHALKPGMPADALLGAGD